MSEQYQLATMREVVSAAILRQSISDDANSYTDMMDMRKRCADVALLMLMPLETNEAIDKLLAALDKHVREIDAYDFGLPQYVGYKDGMRQIVRDWLRAAVKDSV